MPQLILVRHSMPDIDTQVKARDWHLSAEGRQRCMELADALRPYGPRRIVSSPEAKARETADLIAGILGTPLEIDPDLREHGRSMVGAMSQEAFQSAVAELFTYPDELVFGDETAGEALRRFTRAVERACEQHTEGATVLVSHGTVICLFLASISGLQGLSFWRRLGLPAYAVIELPELTISDLRIRLRHRPSDGRTP